jgi:hypothetical protein
MEHTSLLAGQTPGSGPARADKARSKTTTGGRKRAGPKAVHRSIEEHVDEVQNTGNVAPQAGDMTTSAGGAGGGLNPDLTPLVYQIYSRIKRELIIEKERKGS